MMPNHVYVFPFESQIPELRDALSVLQTVGLRTVILGENDPRPKGAHAVIPAEIMSEARVCTAALYVEERLGIPIRASTEKPGGFGSGPEAVAKARARGFDDDAIREALYPGDRRTIDLNELAVETAQAALKQVQKDLVAARARADAPLDDLSRYDPYPEA